jgi:hypothetical protein
MAAEIETAALALIAEHGKRARKLAAREEARARAKGDLASADRWTAVGKAIAALDKDRERRLIIDANKRARSRPKS